MKKYAKIINEETKACEVGLGTNAAFYASIGMEEMEIEQAYNGSWYLQGYAPEKPQEVKEDEVRAVRNSYLQATDIYMLIDYPVTADEREEYKDYRQYLRDYTGQENWWEQNPMDFETWKQGREVLLAEE